MPDTPPPPSTPPPNKPPRRRWLRWLLDIAIVLGVVFAVQAWRTRDVPNETPVPDFSFVNQHGEWSSFAAWRAGQADGAVAVYFWAEWCPICRTIEGSVGAIAEDWPVLSVAMQSGPPAVVARVLDERGLAWPTAVDEDGRLSASFGIRGVPTVLIIDRENRIRFAEVGISSGPGLRLSLWWANRRQV